MHGTNGSPAPCSHAALALCIAPSFVQLFAMLGEPWFAFVAVLLFLSFGTGFARTFLDEWPLRPGLALALLAAVHLLFIQVTAWGDQEAGYLMVLLPALLGLNWFGISLAREFALWTTNRLPLDEREATKLRDACDRLAVPDVGVVTAAVISFAVLTLGDPLLAVLALAAALAFFAGGGAGRSAANEGIVRFFSYNDHECYSPFVFQFEEPFRTPAARRAIFSALTSALGCGLAAAANRPPAITPSLLYDAFCAPSPALRRGVGLLARRGVGLGPAHGVHRGGCLSRAHPLHRGLGPPCPRPREPTPPGGPMRYDFDRIVRRMLYSENREERRHLFLGHGYFGDYPLCLSDRYFENHLVIRGASGRGKSTLLARIIRQLLLAQSPERLDWLRRRGERPPRRTSIVIGDLKGEYRAVQRGPRICLQLGITFKFFTNQVDAASYVFNPLSAKHLELLTTSQLAQVLLEAAGLTYGSGYGKSFFSEGNVRTLLKLLRAFRRSVGSFRELLELLTDPTQRDGVAHISDRELQIGSHVEMFLEYMSVVHALNLSEKDLSKKKPRGVCAADRHDRPVPGGPGRLLLPPPRPRERRGAEYPEARDVHAHHRGREGGAVGRSGTGSSSSVMRHRSSYQEI